MNVYSGQYLIFTITDVNLFLFIQLKKVSLIALLVLSVFGLKAQSTIHTLAVKPVVADQKEALYQWYKPVQQFKDSLELVNAIKKISIVFHDKSYLEAAVDEVKYENDTTFVFVHIGKKYEWAALRKGSLSLDYMRRLGFKEQYFRDRPFRYAQVATIMNKALDMAENTGYPFASIRLDSIQINDSKFEAALDFKSGPYIVYDSIKIVGKTIVKKKYLERELNLIRGKAFSQRDYSNVVRKLKSISFLKTDKAPMVSFASGKAQITLFISDKPSNNLNGIIGLLPNEGIDRRVLVTGELKMHLRNPFGTGKQLKAHWRKMQPLTQQLDLLYAHPNLLQTGVNVQFDLGLLKQDTIFINVDRGLSFAYDIGGNSTISMNTRLKTSRILSNNDFDSLTVPPFLDSDFWSYGLQYTWNGLDDFFYPKRGSLIAVKFSIGNKSIIRNNKVHETHYENLEINSPQYTFEFSSEKYIRTGKQTVFVTGLSGASIWNTNLFQNDLFRVGGLKSLRGFNENNFFTSNYLLGKAELRIYTDESSYVMLFHDHTLMRLNDASGFESWDNPFGFGAGISFTTKGGIFNFIYSLGQSENQRLSFNLSKIHFGLVSNF